MTVVNPEPNNTTAIEPKVKWPALAIYLTGVGVLAVVNALTGEENQLLIEALPDVVEPFVIPLVPTLVGLVTGFFAKHQWRKGEVINSPSSHNTAR